MSNSSVLFIVEGPNDEVRFLEQLYNVFFRDQHYEVYTYCTTIHTLSQVLFNDYPDFEEDEIDIQLLLKSLEKDEAKISILSKRYRDVFLIFDFDPHHDNPHFDTVCRMLRFFDDSTNHGRMYINYPMMQSYKHLRKMPDDSFSERITYISEASKYKATVAKESDYSDVSKYTYAVFVSIAVHQLRKINRILEGEYQTPSKEIFLTWNWIDLYNEQMSRMEQDGFVYVVNTCISLLVEYNPSRFFDVIQKKKNEFDI
ncbi:MAG: hypothetical protein E7298_07705 [Lachnospiraceae bacterium]|nr:hypothetical protein [Lachnospiraceae bacterium]